MRPVGTALADPPALTPRVEFVYDGLPAGADARGTVTDRHCFIRGLTLDQASLVINVHKQ